MAGLSMEALAEKSGGLITKQAIGKYEKGKMKPSGEVLMALSGALGVKPNYFFRSPRTDFSKLNFRKRSNLKAKEIAVVKHRALDFLERYLEIEEILDEKGAFVNPLPREVSIVTNLGHIERAAKSVRTEWGLGVAPVSNLVELLEGHGVRIIEVESNEKFDGISAWADNIPIIAVRKQNDVVRRRFTIAHGTWPYSVRVWHF
jgi:transcriptional regulator with XRE-family HTH domain